MIIFQLNCKRRYPKNPPASAVECVQFPNQNSYFYLISTTILLLSWNGVGQDIIYCKKGIYKQIKGNHILPNDSKWHLHWIKKIYIFHVWRNPRWKKTTLKWKHCCPETKPIMFQSLPFVSLDTLTVHWNLLDTW